MRRPLRTTIAASLSVFLLAFQRNSQAAPEPKVSAGPNASSTYDRNASNYLAPVSDTAKDFYKSLGMARGILSWIEARTEEFRKNAPMPQKNLEPLRQGLGFTGKTGLKPALRAVEREALSSLKDLSETSSQEQGANTLVSGTKRLGRALEEAGKLRERAQALAKGADAGLIGLRDALLRLDERAKALRVENYRRQVVPGLGVIAKSLEGGLKGRSLSPHGGGSGWTKPLVALAATAPREECPAYTPRSVYDECQKRFNEGEKECDRAPDLIAAHKCTDRWLDWLIDVCPGELTKKLCKLVCPKDHELKGNNCEPKALESPCPKANAACSAVGIRNSVLSAKQKEEANQAVTLLSKLPKTNPANSLLPPLKKGQSADLVKFLSDAGIEVRTVKPGDMPEEFSKVVSTRNAKDKKKWDSVLLLREDVFKGAPLPQGGEFKGSPEALASNLGHDLSLIKSRTSFNKNGVRADGGSDLLSEQRASLTQVYIAEELRLQKKLKPEETEKLCPGQSLYCQKSRLLPRIWGGQLFSQRFMPPEFTNDKILETIKDAADAEEKGHGKTERVLKIVSKRKEFKGYADKIWTTQQKDAQKGFRSEMDGQEKAFRKYDDTKTGPKVKTMEDQR